MTTSNNALAGQSEPTITRCSSGSAGLDDVLGGGLPAGHFYLVEGEPGTGKTTLALQFVAEGIKRGEKVLYVTLSESRQELLTVARVHHLAVDGSAVLEVRPSEEDLRPDGQYTVFHPAEVELNDRVQAIMAEVDRRKPHRLVIDALSEVRMLAKDPLRLSPPDPLSKGIRPGELHGFVAGRSQQPVCRSGIAQHRARSCHHEQSGP
jgi:KaiC/GvpD/RAD55 family RecA-like ATPase